MLFSTVSVSALKHPIAYTITGFEDRPQLWQSTFCLNRACGCPRESSSDSRIRRDNMEAPPNSQSDLEKCELHDTPSTSRPAVDVVWVPSDETTGSKAELNKLFGTVSGPGRTQYRISPGLENGNTLVPFFNLANRREQTKRVNTPIIFVAQGSSGLSRLSPLLQSAQQPSEKADESIRTILNATVGVISLPTHNPRDVPISVLYVGQSVCNLIIENYEMWHGASPKPTRTPWAPSPRFVPSALNPIVECFKNPPTFLFVLTALTWASLAAFQYHINQTHRYQRYYLLFGVVMGGLFALPSLTTGGKDLFIATPLAIWITLSLGCSALVNGFRRTFVSTTKKRLNQTIDTWARNIPRQDSEKHVIRFEEIA